MPLSEIIEARTQLYVSSDGQLREMDLQFAYCFRCQIIQKVLNSSYLFALEETYKNYKPYRDTDGQQPVIAGQNNQSRVQVIGSLVSSMARTGLIPTNSNVLDIGAGKGELLKEITRRLPKAKLTAYDPYVDGDPHHALHTTISDLTPDNLKQADLIILNHVLEHIPDARQWMSWLCSHASPKSTAIIQVPDVEANVFDLLVYDHLHHFSAESLCQFLRHCGFQVRLLRRFNDKELTVVVQLGKLTRAESKINAPRTLPFSLLSGLSLVDLFVSDSSIASSPKVVLGAGPIPKLMHARVTGVSPFVIDEAVHQDVTRLEDLTIRHPRSLSLRNFTVVIPQPRATARRIIRRWDQKYPARSYVVLRALE